MELTTLKTSLLHDLDPAMDPPFKNESLPHHPHSKPMEVIDYLEATIKFMSFYYTLLLIVGGCICNTLAIAVLSRRAFRGTSMALYFRFLSIMDLGAILTGLTRFFQISAFGFDVRNDTLSCRFNFWIMNIFLFSSSWTLVVVTTERVLSIVTPHKVRVICSPSRINAIIVSIVVFMAAMNAPIFYILGSVEMFDPGTNTTMVRHCTVVVERHIVHFLFWWYESTMFAFIPCFILIVFNVVILVGIIKSKKKMKKMMKSSSSSSSSSSVVAKNKTTSSGGTSTTEKTTSDKGDNKISSLTVTLLCINVTFIVCNFPICVYQVTPELQRDEQLSRLSNVMVNFFLMLMYTNNAMNFLLYCITGTKFRLELLAMISETLVKLRLKNAPPVKNL